MKDLFTRRRLTILALCCAAMGAVHACSKREMPATGAAAQAAAQSAPTTAVEQEVYEVQVQNEKSAKKQANEPAALDWKNTNAAAPAPARVALPKAGKSPQFRGQIEANVEEKRAADTTPQTGATAKLFEDDDENRRDVGVGALGGSLGLRGFGAGGGGSAHAEGIGRKLMAIQANDGSKEKDKLQANKPDKAAVTLSLQAGQVAVADAQKLAEGEEATADTGETCLQTEQIASAMPRRCHLSSTYLAGTALWQRRLRALADLPPELAAAMGENVPKNEIEAPDIAALSVDARLSLDHIEAAGQVWLRVGLRSTERWGLRRPPIDLAVILGANAAAMADDAACKALTTLASRVEPQDRLTVVWGDGAKTALDGVDGVDAANRVGALCAAGSLKPMASLAVEHGVARKLLGQHAAAQHRVAGTRLIVVLAAAAENADAALNDSVAAAVQEPTLTSVLQIGSDAVTDGWWQLADAGQGAVEMAALGKEAAAAQALWQGWGRVVARLVRVDIRLAPGVVAQRVVGSRVLTGVETRAVRKREQAIDRNLARVAGVQADRKDDGQGMTMLIPAFLGTDSHYIDILLTVPGPGPVADVVVDYKDLIRMTNAKAMARAALDRLPSQMGRTMDVQVQPERALDLAHLTNLRDRLRSQPQSKVEELLGDMPDALPAGLVRMLGREIANSNDSAQKRAAVLALLDTWLARSHGCHVAAGVR